MRFLHQPAFSTSPSSAALGLTGQKYINFGLRKGKGNKLSFHFAAAVIRQPYTTAVGLSHRGSRTRLIHFPLKINNLSDNKRQQTTTVDNKRLINGFVLTGLASLQGKSEKL